MTVGISDPQDLDVVVGQFVPDRQEQAGCQMERLAAGRRQRLVDLLGPQAGEARLIDRAPVRLLEQVAGQMVGSRGPDELVALHRGAIGCHQAPGVQPERNHSRLAVDERLGVRSRGPQGEHPLGRQWFQTSCNLEPEEVRGRPRDGVGADDAVLGDLEPVDEQRLDADVECTRVAGGRDPGFNQGQIFVEDRVLERDRQGQQPVQPPLDGRQVIAQAAIFAFQPQTRAILEIA